MADLNRALLPPIATSKSRPAGRRGVRSSRCVSCAEWVGGAHACTPSCAVQCMNQCAAPVSAARSPFQQRHPPDVSLNFRIGTRANRMRSTGPRLSRLAWMRDAIACSDRRQAAGRQRVPGAYARHCFCCGQGSTAVVPTGRP